MKERKQLADYAIQNHSISLHRACGLLNISRSVHGYEGKKIADVILPHFSRHKFVKLTSKNGDVFYAKKDNQIYD